MSIREIACCGAYCKTCRIFTTKGICHGIIPPLEVLPVIGVAPAVIACIQATEVIKYILYIGRLLTNRSLVYEGRSLTLNKFRVRKDPNWQIYSDLMVGEQK